MIESQKDNTDQDVQYNIQHLQDSQRTWAMVEHSLANPYPWLTLTKYYICNVAIVNGTCPNNNGYSVRSDLQTMHDLGKRYGYGNYINQINGVISLYYPDTSSVIDPVTPNLISNSNNIRTPESIPTFWAQQMKADGVTPNSGGSGPNMVGGGERSGGSTAVKSIKPTAPKTTKTVVAE
jgi:hypothetical protein